MVFPLLSKMFKRKAQEAFIGNQVVAANMLRRRSKNVVQCGAVWRIARA
jgi:hypothetical protein